MTEGERGSIFVQICVKSFINGPKRSFINYVILIRFKFNHPSPSIIQNNHFTYNLYQSKEGSVKSGFFAMVIDFYLDVLAGAIAV